MTEGFLGRWSRLKQRQEDPAEMAESVQELPVQTLEPEAEGVVAVDTPSDEESIESAAEVASSETEVLTDLDMPDLSTIHAGSDMSMFFSSGVSAELRRQALRKFFHQPEFNVRDSLDDYALDYSNPDKLVLKVGDKVRGWAQQQMEDAMQQARDALLQPDSALAEVDGEAVETLDSTKVDEADQLGKNESIETK
ncbi:hypothetical protein ADINL_2200 [Nitrincola lacisaponensis]|uniref:DUF3306 domain-containing protein n=1 Tax=Nitrincola lacisaponensis TaxID=267850 RepID=A0A063Y2S5_9GAMM|nr:DUF3306 domain-containing protein [Nitrincola lacisaponensis]KDE39071.1 hypothetical protein ADINL_2200 [Nitrincola lacisaponensis]